MNTVEPITTISVVRTARDTVSCDLDGEAAILNVQSGEYYGLDDVGAAVWRMISQPRVVAEIIKEITSQYEVDLERCEKDLIGLLGQMAERRLVEIADTP